MKTYIPTRTAASGQHPSPVPAIYVEGIERQSGREAVTAAQRDVKDACGDSMPLGIIQRTCAAPKVSRTEPVTRSLDYAWDVDACAVQIAERASLAGGDL